MKWGARVQPCGCLIRLMGPGLVSVHPCSDRCQRLLQMGPERALRGAGLPFIVRLPVEAEAD